MKLNQSILIALFLATTLVGCSEIEKGESEIVEIPGLVEISLQGLEIFAPDEIPSGWTTFRMTNSTAMVHLAVIERMPDGYGVKEQQEDVAPVFQDGMNLLASGDLDAAMVKFGELPEWFGEIVFMGGPGLLSAGRMSETSVYLEPGSYVIECYVKTDGVFHSVSLDPAEYGMIHGFTVTAEESGAPEPEASINISLSSTNGMNVSGDLTAGDHTVAVHFVDQIVHEHFLGHDVHLVKLNEGDDTAELISWMNWTIPGELETPAPVLFMGGTNEMPGGLTGYFNVSLDAGEYAWIAEVPASDEKGMFVPFTVE